MGPLNVQTATRQSVSERDPSTLAFSIATLVTDEAQYADMVATFARAGFDASDCEFLTIDNTGAKMIDAYRGLDAALNAARGRYVILCHQDVRLTHDTRSDLEDCLAELEAKDPDFALAGNAGGMGVGALAIRISDPHGSNQRTPVLPARVTSLDENFIVVRRIARIGFSRQLAGFHLYGPDICMNAAMAGYSAYAIDFHLTHLSAGNKDQSFYAALRAFRAKWTAALSPRWVQTTCALISLRPGVGHAAIAPALERARRALTRLHHRVHSPRLLSGFVSQQDHSGPSATHGE